VILEFTVAFLPPLKAIAVSAKNSIYEKADLLMVGFFNQSVLLLNS
jgi:hypothetical protein